MTGAILLLGLVLYPYVYLTMRAMFMSQPAHLLEAARTLGLSSTGSFFGWRCQWHVRTGGRNKLSITGNTE